MGGQRGGDLESFTCTRYISSPHHAAPTWTRAATALGGTIVCLFGLCIAEPTLARSLLPATPAELVRPEEEDEEEEGASSIKTLSMRLHVRPV